MIDKVKIAICDDEEQARNDLADEIILILEEEDIAYEIFCFSAGNELLEYINDMQIVFLDMDMPELDGAVGETSDMYFALNGVFPEFSGSVSDNTKKVIVLITDGIATDSENSGTVGAVYGTAKRKNISIYTIGLGDNEKKNFEDTLIPLSDATTKDSDDDGLLDNEPIKDSNGEIIAPKDNKPLWPNEYYNMWKEYIKEMQTGTIATGYASKGSQEILEEILEKLPEEQDKKYVKEKCTGETAAKVGACILNFVQDDCQQGYHSLPETWQKNYGYTKLYDDVFGVGSNMDDMQSDVSVDGKTYVLWLWKGDYWNLGTGAEIGLYTTAKESTSSNPADANAHFDAVDFNLPMQLSLFQYPGTQNRRTYFNWKPSAPQWWVSLDFVEVTNQ